MRGHILIVEDHPSVLNGTADASKVHAFDGDAYVCWLCKPLNTGLLLSVLKNFVPRRAPAESQERTGLSAAPG